MDRFCAAARSQAKFWSAAVLAVLVLTVASAGMSYAAVVWDNGGGDMLWSVGTNWDSNSAPGATDAVTFGNGASSGTQGTVTNIVDASTTIASLAYENTAANYHTTQINTGRTLTVNGNFTVGANTYDSTGVTITGQTAGTGALVVNNSAATVAIDPGPPSWYAPASTVTADLSGLGSFTANVSAVNIARAGGVRPATFNLAQNSSITADKLSMGLWNSTGILNLGQSTVLNVDDIYVAGETALPPGGQYYNDVQGTIQFRSGVTSPTLTIRGKAGGSSRADMTVGVGPSVSNDTVAMVNLNSTTGAALDALLDNLLVGIGNTAATANGTFQFNFGSVDANTVVLGRTGSNGNGVATLTIGGTGSFTAGSITVGDALHAGKSATGTVNLDAGSLRAATIQGGASTGTAVRAFNWTSGTIGNKLGGDLTIAASVPLTLKTTASHVFNAETGRTINVNSVMSESGAVAPVVKTGGGTLALGAGNSYTGATTLSAGKLVIGTTNAIRSGNTLAIDDATTPNTGASANTALDVNYDQTLSNLGVLLTHTPGANTQHAMTIASGRTLTVNGPFQLGIVAGGTTGATSTGSITITGATPGAGALVVNAGVNNVVMGPSDGSYNDGARTSTIDMRGLGSFSATTTNYFYMGSGHNDSTTLYLADSNTINAGKISLGCWNSDYKMYLGQANDLNVDTLSLAKDVPGSGHLNIGTATIQFRPGLANPTVTIDGVTGDLRTDVMIGYGADSGGTNAGTIDLSAGTVNAMLGAVTLGQGFLSEGQGDDGLGTFTFGAGTVDATSITVGLTVAGTRAGNTGTGILNIQGPGTLIAGTLTVADMQDNDAPATGTVNLVAGTLRATTIQKGSGSAAFNWSAGTIGNKLGGDLTVNANMPLTLLTTASHTFDAETGRTITANSAISQSGAVAPITKTGAGTLILSGDLDYTGGTTVDNGILRLAQGGLLFPDVGSTGQFGSAHTVTVNAGGKLQLGTTWVIGDGLANQVVVNGGTLEFYNSDNYLGNIVLTGGNVTTTGGSYAWRTGYLGNGQITTNASASSSTIGGSLYFVANGATADKTTFTVANGAAADDLVVSAAIQDLPGPYAGMSLVKDGAGRMVLSGVNTYTGLTNIVAGQLQTQGGSAILDASNVTIQSGASLRVYNSEAINVLTGPAGSQVIMDNGTNSLTVGAGGGGGTYSGSIVGTGRLIKAGAGTQTLSGDLDHTGGTTVDGGILLLNQAGVPFPDVNPTGQFGSAHTVTVNSGGKLQLGAWWVTGDGLANQVVVNGGTLEFYNSDNYLGNIVLTGGHIITTGGAYPWRTGYFGNGQITTTASASSSTIAGSLDFLKFGSATKTTFTVANGAAVDDLVVSAAIRDVSGYAGMTVTKDGPGRMVLSGTNTYVGATTVNDGTLLVNGSIAGAATVNGGTLGGSGTIGGLVTVNAPGILDPGSSPGVLTLAGGVTFNGGIFSVQLDGITPGVGGYDQLLVTGGNVLINPATQLDPSLNYAAGPLDYLWIILNSGTGSTSGYFAGLEREGSSMTVGGSSFNIYYHADFASGSTTGGNDVLLTTAPEPSTIVALLGLAGLGLAGYLRRRLRPQRLS